jgi:hypothetical protein
MIDHRLHHEEARVVSDACLLISESQARMARVPAGAHLEL